MSDYSMEDPMYSIYIFETLHLLGELENMMIESERQGKFSKYHNKAIRILHNIKGNSMTLDLDNISQISHACEELVCICKNEVPKEKFTEIVDIILEYIDYVRSEINNLKNSKSDINKYLLTFRRINGLTKYLRSI